MKTTYKETLEKINTIALKAIKDDNEVIGNYDLPDMIERKERLYSAILDVLVQAALVLPGDRDEDA